MRKTLSFVFCLLTVAPTLWANAKPDTVYAVEQKNERTIRGVVLDNNGEALPGASILVKGTQNGTVTNLDGAFRLSAKEGQTLIVSFVGMKTQEVVVSKKNDYQIHLDADSKALDEVVVTGYQTLSKERSTGAFAKVSSKTLEMKRMENLSSVLEGQVAGYVDGKIRGVTTMNAIANPMVVIDGFPVENTSINRIGETTEGMPDLNPEDIESITVLKDAAAASIYGARAANGVIVITTKKAQQGKTDVSFSSTFTVQPYSYYTKNMTNSADVIDMQREWANTNPSLLAGGESAMNIAKDLREKGGYPMKGVDILLDMYTNKIGMDEGNRMLDNLAGLGYQYYDQINKYAKRNPFYQQYNLRVGKTTERNSFNFSTSYWKNQYSNLHQDDWKLGMNLTNSLKVTDWMQLDLGVYLKYGEENSQTYNPLFPGNTVMPYDGLVAADGSYISLVSSNDKERDDIIRTNGLYSETITPMEEMNYGLRKNTLFETRAFAKLKIDFTSWLNYNVQYQYETGNSNSELFREVESLYARSMINNFTSKSAYGGLTYNLPNGNMFNTLDRSTRAYNFRQQLNLNKTFNEKHDLVWILGQEVRHMLTQYSDNVLYGYDPELLSFSAYDENALASFNTGLLGRQSLRSADSKSKRELMNRFVSIYSNASYTYDDRYVLSGSIRWDRSNLWGTSAKAQNKPLWSLGGSWNINKEAFFHSDFVNSLRLRASYGIGGNIARGTAPYLIARYYAGSIVPGTSGSVVSPPNPDIRWEKTTTTNIGVDFSLFNNRLSGSVEYYNKSSVDLLANTSLSPTQGFGSSIMTNIGEMVNRGFELTLQGDVIRKKDFNWNATLLYAVNKNKVKNINSQTDLISLKMSMPWSYPTIGEPLNGIYAFEWAGLNESGDPQIYDQDGKVVSTNVSTAKALKYSGTSVPVHSATLTNVIRYKDFELSAMLIFAGGHKLRSTIMPKISMNNGRIVSTGKDIVNRWKKSGDEDYTNIPRLLFSNDQENFNTYRTTLYEYSDLFVYDASNIRVKNIALAYRLPASWCRKVFLSGAKLQFNVENAAIIAFNSKARYDLGAYNAPNYVWGIYLNF